MRSRAWCSLVLAIFWPSAIFTQQTLVPPQTETASHNVLISALNDDGTPASISPSDLRIKLDGHEAFVKELRRVGPAMRYCLALDTGRFKEKTTFRERWDQALAFLNSIPQPERDFGSLVTFDYYFALAVESGDPKELVASLSEVKPTEHRAGALTAVDSAIMGCANRLAKAPTDLPRFIFLFTGIKPSFSSVSVLQPSTFLLRTGIHLYTIGNCGRHRVPSKPVEDQRAPWDCDPPPSDGIGRLPERTCGSGPKPSPSVEAWGLKSLTQESGGKCFKMAGNMAMNRVLSEISRQLSGLLLVTFAEPVPDYPTKLDIRCINRHVSIAAPRLYAAP